MRSMFAMCEVNFYIYTHQNSNYIVPQVEGVPFLLRFFHHSLSLSLSLHASLEFHFEECVQSLFNTIDIFFVCAVIPIARIDTYTGNDE